MTRNHGVEAHCSVSGHLLAFARIDAPSRLLSQLDLRQGEAVPPELLNCCDPLSGSRLNCSRPLCSSSCDRGSSLAPHPSMFNKTRSRFWGVVVIFGLGTAAGAALGLLYAPMTGRRMQRKLADATNKVKDVVEDSVDNVQNVLRKVANA